MNYLLDQHSVSVVCHQIRAGLSKQEPEILAALEDMQRGMALQEDMLKILRTYQFLDDSQ